MSISIRQIRYFIAAAETGNFSRAAIEMNVTQSAVTTAIKDLENHLGVALFARRTNGVDLTREGARFQQHALYIDSAIADAVQASKSSTEELTGTIRLGVTYTVSGYTLAQILSRFARSHPNVFIQPVEMDRNSLESAITDGELDLAMMLTSNLADKRNLKAQRLFSSPRRLWLSTGHPLLGRDRVSLADLKDEPYIMLTVDEAEQTTLKYWNKYKRKPLVHFRTSSLEAVRNMVAAGLGVTILADIVARKWSLDGHRLEARTIDEAIPSLDIGIAWHKRRKLTPTEQAFVEFTRMIFTH